MKYGEISAEALGFRMILEVIDTPSAPCVVLLDLNRPFNASLVFNFCYYL